MNLKSGYPFPLIRNGIPFDYPKLEKNTHADVLIIGGGISGALMAHRLMNSGMNCMIVDARSIGLGSTCASTSLLQYEIDEPLHKLSERMGERAAVRAYKLCAGSIDQLAQVAKETGFTVYRYKKSLQLAAYKKDAVDLRNELDIRKKHGFELEFLSEKELKKEYGIRASCALLTMLAADTDSYLFTHHLLQFHIPHGLRVFDRTKAVRFEYGKRKVQVTTESGYRIHCRFVVFANGYEASQQIPKKLVRFKSTYVTISETKTDPYPFWKNDALIWNTGHPYLYIRSTPDARILVGGRDEPLLTPAKRDRLIPSKANSLKKDFQNLFPGLSIIPEFSWTGLFGSTPDGLPYIGQYPGKPRSFFALGFGGNGITFGQVASAVIADLLLGKKNKDESLFSFNRK